MSQDPWPLVASRIRETTYRAWGRDEPDEELDLRLHEFFAEYGPVWAYPRSLTNMYPVHIRGEK